MTNLLVSVTRTFTYDVPIKMSHNQYQSHLKQINMTLCATEVNPSYTNLTLATAVCHAHNAQKPRNTDFQQHKRVIPYIHYAFRRILITIKAGPHVFVLVHIQLRMNRFRSLGKRFRDRRFLNTALKG